MKEKVDPISTVLFCRARSSISVISESEKNLTKLHILNHLVEFLSLILSLFFLWAFKKLNSRGSP